MTHLIDRFEKGEVPRAGVWFDYGDWSILNCGALMSTTDWDWKATGIFLGWEAMKGEEIIRRDSWEELLQALTPQEALNDNEKGV